MTNIGEGHGIAGRFAGLPDPFGNLSTAAIVLLPIPFDKTTTYQQGTDKGPEAIIEASRNLELYDIETNSQVYRQGIYTAEPVEEESSEKMIQRCYERAGSYLNSGKYVVGIGGEHSVSYPLIKAHAEKYSKISVLQFDAHADLQPAYEGNPWSHASVMARVQELPQVDHIVSVGIRSLSSEELPTLEHSRTFFAHELEGGWMDRVLANLSPKVYISFDLDVFDSSLMPATGTPEPGGLFWNTACALLRRVFRERQVIGFDVVELCPIPGMLAPDYLAAKLVYKMLSYKFDEKGL